MTGKIRKVVLTFTDRTDLYYVQHSTNINKHWADKRGYDYLLIDGKINKMLIPEDRSIHWSKILACIQTLNLYDVVIWVDDDAVLLDNKVHNLSTKYYGSDVNMIVSADYQQVSKFNAGVMIMFKNPRLINKLVNVYHDSKYQDYYYQYPYEQKAINDAFHEPNISKIYNYDDKRYFIDGLLVLDEYIINGDKGPHVMHLATTHNEIRTEKFYRIWLSIQENEIF